MENRPTNIFERNQKKTIAIIILLFIVLSTSLTELLLEKVYGLGNVVLYKSNPLYGFRPIPNQTILRSTKWYRPFKVKMAFNNLALRAEDDWGEKKDDKILFLGDSVANGGSFVDNKELLSYLAVSGLKNYKAGNAAVQAWGIENIYGLIVDSNFIPAKFYITIVPEEDFYRGLTRTHGQPYYNVSPRYALLELWRFFCFSQSIRGHIYWVSSASHDEKQVVATKATKKLKEMDIFLKNKGFVHLLYISPTRDQVLASTGKKDEIVQGLLKNFNIDHIYILDELNKYNLNKKEKELIFYDRVHLDKKGHEIWAKIIRNKLIEITK